MRRISRNGLAYYQFDRWAENGPVHGVFTRLGGVSRPPWQSLNVGSTVGDNPAHVARNRLLMAEALAFDIDQTCTVWQVHSNDTIVVSAPATGESLPPGIQAKADGMVTDRPGLPLVMRFADCVPVMLYDPVRRVVGIAHAGWRGTVAGVGSGIVRTMQETYGCRVEDIQAGIGPSIGPECYEVGPEVVAAFESAFGGLDGLVRYDGRAAYLNLWEANRRALIQAGVLQVEVAGICTATRTDEFFSHRAERGRTGRFGAVIALPGEDS